MSMSYQKADDAGRPVAEAIEDVYSLSPLQQGMLFHHLYEAHSGVDIEQVVYRLRDGLHVAAFKRAWQQIVDRHAVLRTGFRWEGLDSPLQLVHRQIKLEWEEVDWRLLPAAEQSARLDDYLRRDRRRGFAMTEPTLNRMALFRESDSGYQFVWTFHHAIIDGRSIALILKEVFAYYEAFCDGGDLALSLPRRYRDYIDWLDRLDLSRAVTYWLETLRRFTSPLPRVTKRAAEHTPLIRVEEWSDVPRGRSLFDSILVFENYELGAYLKAQGERWQNGDFELLERTNYPLALSGWAGPELLSKLAYHQRDFDDHAINRMLGHLRTLLESMPAQSEQSLAGLPMLTAQERDQLLIGWNDTQADYPAQTCVQQLFEAQVERTPEAVAVICGSEQLSYSELNGHANQLARHLQTHGVGRESLVGIAL